MCFLRKSEDTVEKKTVWFFLLCPPPSSHTAYVQLRPNGSCGLSALWSFFLSGLGAPENVSLLSSFSVDIHRSFHLLGVSVSVSLSSFSASMKAVAGVGVSQEKRHEYQPQGVSVLVRISSSRDSACSLVSGRLSKGRLRPAPARGAPFLLGGGYSSDHACPLSLSHTQPPFVW